MGKGARINNTPVIVVAARNDRAGKEDIESKELESKEYRVPGLRGH